MYQEGLHEVKVESIWHGFTVAEEGLLIVERKECVNECVKAIWTFRVQNAIAIIYGAQF